MELLVIGAVATRAPATQRMHVQASHGLRGLELPPGVRHAVKHMCQDQVTVVPVVTAVLAVPLLQDQRPPSGADGRGSGKSNHSSGGGSHSSS
jgi:hypothetical protein